MGKIFALVLSCFLISSASLTDVESKMKRDLMIKQIISYGDVTDSRVLEVMGDIAREDFVPGPLRSMAYSDGPLPIGYSQTISQPYIVAYMTSLLELKKEAIVLEIGTGSGYQAAVLSKLCKKVYTIEIVKELGLQAQKNLIKFKNVHVQIGDGYRGLPEFGPFDAILLTAAPPSIPAPLIEQLAEGGFLVAPVGEEGGVQRIIRLKKSGGEIQKEYFISVRFVPMTGKAQE